MRILAVIPARRKSKGVIRKNTRSFNGKPLLAHTIESALRSEYVDRVIVSTDDKKTALIAKKYGAEVPFLRPSHLAKDSSEVADAMIHLLDVLKKKETYIPDLLLLLQPTSPLRKSTHIDEAVRLYMKTKADSLVSVCRTENLLFTKNSTHTLSVTNPKLSYSSNRQNFPTYYKLDGSMIYLTKVALLIKNKSFISGKLVGYEIDRWCAVDIDEPQDFVVGEILHKHYDVITKKLKKFK